MALHRFGHEAARLHLFDERRQRGLRRCGIGAIGGGIVGIGLGQAGGDGP